MSYPDQPGGPYPPARDPRDLVESQYPPPPAEYPPPPGEEDDRARAYHQRMPLSNNVTLPTISPYDPQYAPSNGYPQDPRAYRPDPYHPGQQAAYGDRPYQGEYSRGGPQHMAFSQSAPRQRTAIACRYCRRRKVSTNVLFLLAQCEPYDGLRKLGDCSRQSHICLWHSQSKRLTPFGLDSLFRFRR